MGDKSATDKEKPHGTKENHINCPNWLATPEGKGNEEAWPNWPTMRSYDRMISRSVEVIISRMHDRQIARQCKVPRWHDLMRVREKVAVAAASWVSRNAKNSNRLLIFLIVTEEGYFPFWALVRRSGFWECERNHQIIRSSDCNRTRRYTRRMSLPERRTDVQALL